MANDRKKQQEHELNLYKRFMQNNDKEAFQELYKSYKPLLNEATKKASYNSNIPQAAHKMYAAQNFMDSLKTFDPNKASLNTHVYNAVNQKANRLNYQYQNLGHMPETRQMQIGKFQSEMENMRADLGREPSQAELSDRLGLGLKDVSRLQTEVRKDLALAEGTEEQTYFESSQDEEMLDYLYYDLGEEEKVVYEYMFGKHGKPRYEKPNKKVDYKRIASQVNFSESKVRSLANNIAKKLDRVIEK